MEQPQSHQVSAQTKWYGVMGASVIVIVALFFLSSLFKGSSGASKFESSVQSITETNPSTVSVKIQVTNSGTKAGTPLCTIEVGNQSSGPSGNYEFEMNDELASGKSGTSTQQVSVSDQGAAKISSGTISCS